MHINLDDELQRRTLQFVTEVVDTGMRVYGEDWMHDLLDDSADKLASYRDSVTPNVTRAILDMQRLIEHWKVLSSDPS